MKIIIGTPQNPLSPMKSRFPYHFHFDVWALVLLAVELSANIVWQTYPPEPDSFRVESALPVLDGVVSVVRKLMLGTLILFARKDAPQRMSRPWKMATVLLVAVYLGAWVALYHGFAGLPTILMLSIAPLLLVRHVRHRPQKLAGSMPHSAVLVRPLGLLINHIRVILEGERALLRQVHFFRNYPF